MITDILTSLTSVSSQGASLFVEDVFSTWIYTGNGSTQTITNGVDLAGKGGMVWLKNRTGSFGHWLWDTARGAGYSLNSDNTLGSVNIGTTEGVSFTASGFSMGNNINWNQTGTAAASWTFRKAAKFFDVVTFTATRSGSGWSGGPRVISHSLGSTPGCVIWKAVDQTSNWYVHHRSTGNNSRLFLNTTDPAVDTGAAYLTPGSTTITFENATCGIVADGVTVTIVAYLFAHDAGGFGAAGSQNVISCGSFTTNVSGIATVNLGWEPQFLLYKRTDNSLGGDWRMFDNMRGWTASDVQRLLANTSGTETGPNTDATLNASGFGVNAAGSATYIYMAIRRGPMKKPTDATKVFFSTSSSGGGSSSTAGFRFFPDLLISKLRTGTASSTFVDRLRNNIPSNSAAIAGVLAAQSISAEQTLSTYAVFTANNQHQVLGSASSGTVGLYLKRAPSFFDIVCYTSPGTSGYTINHNLGAVPELIFIKSRSVSSGYLGWAVYHKDLGVNKRISLTLADAAADTSIYALSSTPTSTQVVLGNSSDVAFTNGTFVAYLFASCPGVSKVGSYTGNGTSLNINCDFTNGAKFILIKRTDSSGDWYFWESDRGILAAAEFHSSFNNTNAEVEDDSVDPLAAGFTVNQLAGTNINVNNATYIYLAIA